MLSFALRTPPPSTSANVYQASVYSTYSSPQAYPSLNNSCERLLPQKKGTPQSKLRYPGPTATVTHNRHLRSATGRRRMSSNGAANPMEIEQKKSYGIGGAGNIRRPSDVIYPIRINPDGTRRRSSIFSSITTTSPSTSPEGKRDSLMSFLRKGSTGLVLGESDLKRYKDGETEHSEH